MEKFNSSDIKWVKNIKRDKGRDWAYFEENTNLEFNLNFSNYQKNGAEKLRQREIILLFQRVDQMAGIAPQTYLTHLVAAVDNELILNENVPEYPWERRVAVIARANPKTAIFTSPHDLNFFKPNRGKLCDVLRLDDTSTREIITSKIWRLFDDYFNIGIDEYIDGINHILYSLTEEDFSALEGTEKETLKKHLIRERNPELIRQAKHRAMEEGNGRIRCVCCRFDFKQNYGDLGIGYIEAHHKIPISTGGERINKCSDLAMVCSNCHRMLHRKNQFGNYFSLEELKEIFVENSSSL